MRRLMPMLIGFEIVGARDVYDETMMPRDSTNPYAARLRAMPIYAWRARIVTARFYTRHARPCRKIMMRARSR